MKTRIAVILTAASLAALALAGWSWGGDRIVASGSTIIASMFDGAD